mgnify:FL=1
MSERLNILLLVVTGSAFMVNLMVLLWMMMNFEF